MIAEVTAKVHLSAMINLARISIQPALGQADCNAYVPHRIDSYPLTMQGFCYKQSDRHPQRAAYQPSAAY
ncbi:hypothetical protein D3C76_1549940 [compost metagenome]